MTLEEIAAAVSEMAQLRKRVEALEAAANQSPEAISVTLDRAKAMTGVPVSRLRAWIAAGVLPASREKRRWLVEVVELRRVVREMRTLPERRPVGRADIEAEAESILARLPRRAAR